MNRSLPDTPNLRSSLEISLPWLENDKTKTQLFQAHAKVEELLGNPDVFVDEITKYLVNANSKHMRPALLLLSAEYGPFSSNLIIQTAAAIEMIHLASLYHDDVIDEAEKRRALPSVNIKWGNNVAVWAGNHIVTTALQCFAAAGDKVNQTVSRAMSNLWQGQMTEIESAYNLDLDVAGYFTIIEKKTATLSELPCRLGAYLSHAADDVANALSVYGRYIGMAFQIIDDVLDIIATETQLHKPTGNDLKEGIYTLPVINFLKHNTPDSTRLRMILLQKKLFPHQIKEALYILNKNHAADYALHTAQSLVKQAKHQIAPLPDDDTKASLLNLTDHILQKVYEYHEGNRSI